MKLDALLVFCFVAVVLAVPLPKDYYNPESVKVLNYENDNTGTGRHRYSFKQSDGAQAEQEGELRNEGTDDEIYVVKGSFSWVGPDGVKHTVHYVADENGYQPEPKQGISSRQGLILPLNFLSSSVGG